MDEEMIALLVPLVTAAIGLMLQELRKRDTNQHGDAFIDMAKRGLSTVEKFAEPFPSLTAYIDELRELVDEAEEIWESSHFTAEDARFIAYKYDLLQEMIARDLDRLRKLKE